MNLSRHAIDRLPTMGEGAFARVSVAEWTVTTGAAVKATKPFAKAFTQGVGCPPGTLGGLLLKRC